ncbi:MAG: thymidylate synthase [Candidatus Zambryskibacteria bacterium RIFCSPHIGHO2_02_FULL_43_14]|uniref:Thymidylate synthase n=1 Tax=Candidatus Zambryskibacteria bacterium RIFCSPHIGHO2_02_FULL_43_14 TaxID=1802748 RepID=A0A1G2TE40_9BACT|nr:MAG: thymidylate synthase [Candidatus Zambryskibacteria bacterium RIFCSPHIGHO2_01_FULL_43_60]OHA95564.1 MAG: thymidylate synthase [Candidatus Zambryskibacteria bacterium RIFCSPHIGHO2_02_FULL_43_14]OHB02919.1 MAG: thymidylate synthase [Candidatus Zambryskibacteria bacterium RIFCSPLOWO2_01_FULL_42_41]
MNDKSHPEYQYLNLLQDILDHGVLKKDHNTGNGLISVFGRQCRYDLSKGFPLLTTKKMAWNSILTELAWFITGQTNIKYLVDRGCPIWNDYPYKIYKKKSDEGKFPQLTLEKFVEKIKTDGEFAKAHGELPRIYGEQWRAWPASDGRKIDQLAWVVDTLKNFPERKHAVMSVWNPQFLYAMAKPGEALSFPLCHILLHFNVANGKLSCLLYQRSCDTFLGVPFNIASYAALTMIIAKICGYEPGEFVHTLGDVHIYEDHIEQVKEQLTRDPKPFCRLILSDEVKDLDNFAPEMVQLDGYESHPPLRAKMTVAGGFDEKDRK